MPDLHAKYKTLYHKHYKRRTTITNTNLQHYTKYDLYDSLTQPMTL